ncbi:MAG: hypothetical protein V9F00_05850 [Nocardioides sp.]
MPDFNFAGDPMRPARRDLEHQIEKGLIAGIASAIPTAILLALGGVISGYGAATPFYSVISIVDPGPLKDALKSVAEGSSPDFYQLQVSGGIGLCFVMGAVSGLVFAFGTRKAHIQGFMRYFLGALHGIFMMCLFYLVGLRLVAALAGIDAVEVMSLSKTVGWPMLVFAHALHGIVIAWVMRSNLLQPQPVFGPPITGSGASS